MTPLENDNQYIDLRGIGRIKLSELQFIFENYDELCDCELCAMFALQKHCSRVRKEKEDNEAIKRQAENEERIMRNSDD